MNRVLHFKQTGDKKVYFTSDLHLNHNPKWTIPLWKSRGFNSHVEMNDGVIDSINSTVDAEDILWMLGDFCLNTTESQFEEFLSRINCQNIYNLFGNHNSQIWNVYNREVKKSLGHTEFPEGLQEIYPFRYRNLVFCGNYAEVSVDGQYCILSHYPIYVFNYMKDRAWMLTGHSHGSCPLSQSTNTDSKILDVGWDVFKRPITIDEIRTIMNTKGKLEVDHHR